MLVKTTMLTSDDSTSSLSSGPPALMLLQEERSVLLSCISAKCGWKEMLQSTELQFRLIRKKSSKNRQKEKKM